MYRPLQYLCCLLLLQACQAPSPSDEGATLPHLDTLVVDSTLTANIPVEDSIVAAPAIDYDTSQWAELVQLDASFILDLKYATTDNFVKEQMYDCPRCFLRPDAAQALVGIQKQLQEQGLGIKLLDCYRPRPIQQKLWDKVPNASYVTPPAKGSMHNRGRAVDLTLVDQTGRELDMGTPFDFFGPRAHHTHTALPDSILDRRTLLKSIMEANGFRSIRTEWWHYYYVRGGFPLDDWLWPCHGNGSEASILN